MIPAVTLTCDASFPRDAVFKLPARNEISDEGFGYFRDTWFIGAIGTRVANAVLAADISLTALADSYSASEDEFDAVARALEAADKDLLPSHLIDSPPLELSRQLLVGASEVGSLELGVASLSHALSAVGVLTAASCRGHPEGWADHPVVYFAAQELRAKVLQPLVDETGCGFSIDAARDELIVLEAPSVTCCIQLAERVLDARADFRSARVPRRPRSGGAQGQLELRALTLRQRAIIHSKCRRGEAAD